LFHGISVVISWGFNQHGIRNGNYRPTSSDFYIAIENGPCIVGLPVQNGCHCYFSLPEGITHIWWSLVIS
jgi:hypothetical protein